MLHLQLLGRDPLNPAVIAERVLFEDQVAPLNVQSIAFQNQLFTLRGQQARVMRGGDHSNRRNNDANEQAEWQLPKPQEVVTDHARQSMALVASYRPFNLA